MRNYRIITRNVADDTPLPDGDGKDGTAGCPHLFRTTVPFPIFNAIVMTNHRIIIGNAVAGLNCRADDTPLPDGDGKGGAAFVRTARLDAVKHIRGEPPLVRATLSF